MPIYTFDCPECDHATDVFSSFESKPETVDCEQCGAEAAWRSINWQPPPKPQNHHVVYGKGLDSDEFLKKERLMQFSCEDCGETTFEWLSGVPPETYPCETEGCGGQAKRVVRPKLDMHWARYPYYDRALGVMLKSESHRREVCRQQGVVPVDGDWDMAGEISKQDAKIDEEKDVYRDYYDRINNDPAYKDVRKKIDQGKMAALLPPD
tara:strand:- start:1292 stop:1915 length:624 start_codon:yes stop_codon:yes gene_type:complete